jgi:hypothetical protein
MLMLALQIIVYRHLRNDAKQQFIGGLTVLLVAVFTLI